MNAEKIGKLICDGRRKKEMTQSQLAEKINVSDKTVSKWECGNGCPDISLIGDISKVLEIDVLSLLCGEIRKNRFSGGNMKKIQFYKCSTCNNLVVSTNSVQVSCCGKVLSSLKVEGKIKGKAKDCGGEFYIQFESPMSKDDFVSGVFVVFYDRVLTVPMFAEQEPAFIVHQIEGAEFFVVKSGKNSEDKLFLLEL